MIEVHTDKCGSFLVHLFTTFISNIISLFSEILYVHIKSYPAQQKGDIRLDKKFTKRITVQWYAIFCYRPGGNIRNSRV